MAGKKRAGGGAKAFMKAVMSRGEAATNSVMPSTDADASKNETERSINDSSNATAAATPDTTAATADMVQKDVIQSRGDKASRPAQLSEAVADLQASETQGQMQQRQQKELKKLKETTKKLGKKRKEEAEKLEAELNSRHAAEAAFLIQQNEQTDESLAQVQNGHLLDGMAVAAAPKVLSRAQKRREKASQQQAEREQRIAEEKASLGNSRRLLEEAALAEQLQPHHLTLREIPPVAQLIRMIEVVQPDGNCLFRAVEDQLEHSYHIRQASSGTDGEVSAADTQSPTLSTTILNHQQLRAAAVSYMRSHEAVFMPFALPEAGDAGEGEADASVQFQQYCDTMADPAVWGGQAEISALTHVLQRSIRVFSVDMPPLTMGAEYAGRGSPLQISFQRHAYELGEHYNSLVPCDVPQATRQEESYVMPWRPPG